MCSVVITNTLRNCASLNMLKESALAGDVEHLPPDGLHHVYNFSVTGIEIVFVLLTRRAERIEGSQVFKRSQAPDWQNTAFL